MSSRSKTSSKRNGSNGNGHSEDTKAQWSTQAYSLEDLVKQFTFPQVVRCNSTLVTKRGTPLPVNLTQPMLLYEKRTVKKLLARNVMYDARIRKYNETDETVVIPSDYEGHFVRLRSRTAKDHTVHRSLESVVSCKVPAFLNLVKVTAFHFSPPTKVAGDHPRVDYPPGNVFVVEKLISGAAKVKASKSTNGSIVQEMHYLKCRDEKNVEVIIAMNHPGEFAEILVNPLKNGKLSMVSEDIMNTQKFPIVVRYVYGGNKPRLTNFSGLFTLLDAFDETGIIACVMNTTGFTLIELPMSSPMSFKLALNSHDLFHLPVMKNALRLCEKKSPTFQKDLKFKFKFASTLSESEKARLNQSLSSEDGADLVPLSARITAEMGITQTYFYL